MGGAILLSPACFYTAHTFFKNKSVSMLSLSVLNLVVLGAEGGSWEMTECFQLALSDL